MLVSIFNLKESAKNNNDVLAQYYKEEIAQIITIWPIVWKHYPYKNWEILIQYEFDGNRYVY